MAKNKLFDKEEDLARVIVEWLEEDEWDVYQEVQIYRMGACADIIAVRESLIWIIECKLSIGLGVIEQAQRWMCYAHHRSIAVPYRRDGSYNFAQMVARKFGIGIITALPYGQTAQISQPVLPTFDRKVMATEVLAKLRPEYKHFAPAGTARGGHWTPYKRTCESLLYAVTQKPGIGLKEALDGIETHYASPQTARATLAKRLEKGQVKGVRIERQGRLIKLYPDI